MKQKLAIAGVAIVGAFAPLFAFADTFSTSSAETISQGKVDDLGAFLTAYLPASSARTSKNQEKGSLTCEVLAREAKLLSAV